MIQTMVVPIIYVLVGVHKNMELTELISIRIIRASIKCMAAKGVQKRPGILLVPTAEDKETKSALSRTSEDSV